MIEAEWWVVTSPAGTRRRVLVVQGRIAAEEEQMNPFGSNQVGQAFAPLRAQWERRGNKVERLPGVDQEPTVNP